MDLEEVVVVQVPLSTSSPGMQRTFSLRCATRFSFSHALSLIFWVLQV